jgi:hypothetical protein
MKWMRMLVSEGDGEMPSQRVGSGIGREKKTEHSLGNWRYPGDVRHGHGHW